MKRLVLTAFLVNLSVSNSVFATSYLQANQILAAAHRGDTATIEAILAQGANINYVDQTGLSIVCTALLNSDMYAVQILQQYGADASDCNKQIKARNNSTATKKTDGGFFSGLSSYQQIALGVLGIGGAAVLVAAAVDSDLFDSDSSSNSGSNHSNNGSGGGGSSTGVSSFKVTLPGMPAGTSGTEASNLSGYASSNTSNPGLANGFNRMSATVSNAMISSPMQNFLLLTRSYNAFARGYFGAKIYRTTNNNVVSITDSNSTTATISSSDISTGSGSSIQTALITNTSVGTKNMTGNLNPNEKVYYYAYNVNADKPYSLSIDTTDGSTIIPGTYLTKVSGDINSNLNQDNNTVLLRLLLSDENVEYNSNIWTNPNDIAGINPYGVASVYAVDTASNGTIYDQILQAKTDNLDIVAIANVNFSSTDFTSLISNYNIDSVYSSNGSASSKVLFNQYLSEKYSGLANITNTLDSVYNYNYNSTNSNPFVIMPAGEYLNNQSLTSSLVATFENAVPLVYSNMKHLFATTMAVQLFNVQSSDYDDDILVKKIDTNGNPIPTNTGATSYSSADSDIGFGSNVAYGVANSYNYIYSDGTNTYSYDGSIYTNTSNSKTYAYNSDSGKFVNTNDSSDVINSISSSISSIATTSRICGIGGTGASSVDPWCFAVPVAYNDVNGPSISNQSATIMAGAFGLVKGAFSYMTNDQIFLLLAMTSDGNVYSDTELQKRYVLPTDYQNEVNLGNLTYETAFKKVYGYGVINLDRATQPGSVLNFYTTAKSANLTNSTWGQNSVSDVSGWRYGSGYSNSINVSRSAVSYDVLNNSNFIGSNVLNTKNINLTIPFYDVISTADNSVSMPRIFEMNFTADSYNTLSDSQRLFNQFGFANDDTIYKDDAFTMNLSFRNEDLSTSDVAQKINNMAIQTKLTSGIYLNASIGHELSRISLNTDMTNSYNNTARITNDDLANPYLSLVSNARLTSIGYSDDRFSTELLGFNGEISVEELTPDSNGDNLMLNSNSLGDVYGFGSMTNFNMFDKKLSFGIGSGMMFEKNTILGAYGTGLLSTESGATTTYIDSILKFNPFDRFELIGRYTMANTKLNGNIGGFISNFSDLKSDAISIAMNYKTDDKDFVGFMLSRPLAINSGNMEYVNSDFEIIESNNGYSLVTNPYFENINLSPDNRETRLQFVYQSGLSDSSALSFGAMYRINPNNTKDLGNESLFMLKFRQTVGF